MFNMVYLILCLLPQPSDDTFEIFVRLFAQEIPRCIVLDVVEPVVVEFIHSFYNSIPGGFHVPITINADYRGCYALRRRFPGHLHIRRRHCGGERNASLSSTCVYTCPIREPFHNFVAHGESNLSARHLRIYPNSHIGHIMRHLALIAVAALAASVAAAPAHVLFVVDGAPEWGALMGALPKADVLLRMVPGGGDHPESAGAASAMSTGCVGERRAVAARGVPLGARAARAGAATGAVTNACTTDPTVAAFFATSPDRYNTAALAASVRAAGLAVNMGGSSRLFLPPNATGDACFPTTRSALTASLGACPVHRQLVGAFGDARAALAAECLPLPFASAAPGATPSLAYMTKKALARLGAAQSGAPVFLVVGADRLDHAAHSGDAKACEAEVAATVAAIREALTALAARMHASDALVIVTGDHITVMNSTQHTNRSVPVLIYGTGATAAAERLLGVPLSSAHMMRPPLIAATDFPRLFPFFPSNNRGCSPERASSKSGDAFVFEVAGVIALALAAVICCWQIVARRKVE